MTVSPGRVAHFLLYAATFAVLAALALDGADYYATPLAERPRHERFWELKPGGTTAHAYGIAGAGLMVLMLGYSVRKRSRRLRHAGRLRTWLQFHIWCGVAGPLLVVLHSSLKVQGLVALSFWSMVVVALSGFLGRYLYLQIPRRRSGDELSLAEAEALGRETTRRLREERGVPDEILGRLDAVVARSAEEAAGFGLLLRLPLARLRLRLRLAALRRELAGREDRRAAALDAAWRLVRQRAELQQRILLWERLQELFHYWHVLHKPFAVVMYIFLVVHVAVAMATGYGWSLPW